MENVRCHLKMRLLNGSRLLCEHQCDVELNQYQAEVSSVLIGMGFTEVPVLKFSCDPIQTENYVMCWYFVMN